MQVSYRNSLSRSLAFKEINACLKTCYEIQFYCCNSLTISLEITIISWFFKEVQKLVILKTTLQFKRELYQQTQVLIVFFHQRNLTVSVHKVHILKNPFFSVPTDLF